MHVGVILDTEFKTDIRVHNEVSYLKNQGFRISVLCPNFGNKLNREDYQGVKIYRFRFSRTIKNKLFGIVNLFPLYNWLWAIIIRKFIKKTGVVAIHTHDLYMAKPVQLVNKRKKLPLILDLHENYPEAILSYEWSTRGFNKYLAQPKKWKKKEGQYLSYADKLVVLSESFKEDLLKRFNFLKKENIYVYSNVPDIKMLLDFPIENKILLKEQKTFILFYFGGISKRRGIITCIQALEKLVYKYDNIKLLLIGPIDNAEQNEFQDAFSNESTRNNIIFYPWKDIKYLPSYISISDVCLSPIIKNKQHESGVANKIFQYMLFKKPLLVSDCGPQADIVEKEKCGLVFKNEDPKDLADKIEILYNNPALRSSFGENGRTAVLEKYNIDAVGKNLLQMYSSLK